MWFRLYISDFLALNRRHKPFLALLGDCSSYSYFLNRGSKLTYQASLGKPTVVARRSFVNLYGISMQDGAFSLGYNNGMGDLYLYTKTAYKQHSMLPPAPSWHM